MAIDKEFYTKEAIKQRIRERIKKPGSASQEASPIVQRFKDMAQRLREMGR